MYNMRIDVIRKELERRFREVEKLDENDHTEIEETVSKFLYFLLSDLQIRDFIIGLSHFDEDYIRSETYQNIIGEIKGVLKNITSELIKYKFTGKKFKNTFNEIHKGLGNPFNLPKPNVRGKYITIDRYLNALKKIDNYIIDYANELDGIISTINKFIDHADDINMNYNNNNNKLLKLLMLLQSNKVRIDSYLDYKAEYESASSLYQLLPYLKTSHYWYLLNLGKSTLGESIKVRTISRKSEFSVQLFLIDECRQVYHAVDEYLLTGKSKSALIERLKTYCMWIRRDDFPKANAEGKEDKVSKIVSEFIFNQGYFPIVRFRAGKSEPDILYEPSGVVHWDNSVLIELKQYIGKTYSKKQFQLDVGQARDYLSIVKGVKPDIGDTVYLLVFYAGTKRFILDESFSDDKVQVEFIYVGEGSPSKLKGEIIYGSK